MNFKKILLTLTATLVTIGAVACSSCASKPPPGPSPVPTVEVLVDAGLPDAGPVVVKGPHYELTLPGPGWESREACTQNGCANILANEELKNLVFVVSKPYSDSVDEYVLMAVRSAREAGANLLSTKYVTINGHNFVLLELSRGADKIWLWFTILNGQGIELSCGGPDADGHQHDLCFGVASTLKVN